MKRFGYEELKKIMLNDNFVFVAFNKTSYEFQVVRMLSFNDFEILGFITMNQFLKGDFFKSFETYYKEYYKVCS